MLILLLIAWVIAWVHDRRKARRDPSTEWSDDEASPIDAPQPIEDTTGPAEPTDTDAPTGR
jgi:hypothetical protein